MLLSTPSYSKDVGSAVGSLWNNFFFFCEFRKWEATYFDVENVIADDIWVVTIFISHEYKQYGMYTDKYW